MVDGGDVRPVPSTSDDEVPGGSTRGQREQDQPDLVRLTPEQGQTVACVLARAVQQDHQGGKAPRLIGSWYVEVAVAHGPEPQRLQAGRCSTGHLLRLWARPQVPFRMRILVFHAGSSVPPSLPGYTLVPGEWGAISLSTRTYLILESRN